MSEKYQIISFSIETKLNEYEKEYLILTLKTEGNNQLIYELFIDERYKTIEQLKNALSGLNKSISNQQKVEFGEYTERTYIFIKLDETHQFSGRKIK